MLNHKGFSCWVNCSGRPLVVYGEQLNEGDVKTAWIASEVGKNFSVCWKDKSGKRIATSGHVFVDGKDVASAIIRPGRQSHVERSGAKRGSRSVQPFAFSELTLTDDDRLVNRYDASLAEIGTIKVEITRVRLGQEVPFEGYDVQNHGLVHERAKKAGAHCTRFEPKTATGRSRTVAVSTAPYDPDEPGPYVTFVFRYRSEAMLKALEIISAGNKRDVEVIDVGSDTDEDNEAPSSSLGHRGNESTSRKKVKLEPAVAVKTLASPSENEHAVDGLGQNINENIDETTVESVQVPPSVAQAAFSQDENLSATDAFTDSTDASYRTPNEGEVDINKPTDDKRQETPAVVNKPVENYDKTNGAPRETETDLNNGQPTNSSIDEATGASGAEGDAAGETAQGLDPHPRIEALSNSSAEDSSQETNSTSRTDEEIDQLVGSSSASSQTDPHGDMTSDATDIAHAPPLTSSPAPSETDGQGNDENELKLKDD